MPPSAALAIDNSYDVDATATYESMLASQNGGTITASGTTIWSIWINQATCPLTMTATTNNTVWTVWNSTGTTSTLSATNPWNNWVSQQGQQILVRRACTDAPAIITLERQAEIDAQAAEARRERAQRAAERKAADERARMLLLEHLTPEQREYVKKHKFFVIEGGKSKKKYRIWTERGTNGNVERLKDDGHPDLAYCVHLTSDKFVFPHSDHILGQKLMLEMAEEEIMKVANIARRF